MSCIYKFVKWFLNTTKHPRNVANKPILFFTRKEYIDYANVFNHPICYKKWAGYEVYITDVINF
jgi:hypothetical protein